MLRDEKKLEQGARRLRQVLLRSIASANDPAAVLPALLGHPILVVVAASNMHEAAIVVLLGRLQVESAARVVVCAAAAAA